MENTDEKNMQDNPGTGESEVVDARKEAVLHPPVDANSMMMAYAGPAQMNQNLLKAVDSNLMFTAYAGPQMPNLANQMWMQGVYAGPQGAFSPMMKAPDDKKETACEGIYCFCPTCGTKFMVGTKFCSECGMVLKDVQRYRDCPDCGTRLYAEEKFCRECGKKQDTEEIKPA